MFAKYIQKSPDDYRGSVKLLYGDTAYTSVEVLEADMTELTAEEVQFVKDKTDGFWLSMRDDYLSRIDRVADEVRLSYMEVGFRSIDIEYRQVQNAIEEWEVAGKPMDNVPEEIQIWADVNNQDVNWAIENIKVEMGRLQHVVRTLRTARLQAKMAIRDAVTEELATTFETHKAILEGMKNQDPQY